MPLLKVDESGNRTIIETRFSMWYRPRWQKWWILTMKPKLIPDILTRDFRGRPWPIIQTVTQNDPRDDLRYPEQITFIFDEFHNINQQRGVSLISILTVLACVMVVAAIMAPAIKMHREGRLQMIDGNVVKSTCVRGYEFVQIGNEPARQVFDDKGHGVPCKETGP